MNITRIAAVVSAAAFVVAAAPATATETAAPAACGATAPAVAEGEQLVERTLYFHGASAVGDADSYPGMAGSMGPLTLSPEAPTGTQPKADTNASTAVYPATLPGNPIMSAWHTYLDETTRIACFGFTYWAVSNGSDMAVQLHPDSAFILGETPPVTATASGTGTGIVKYTSAMALPAPLTIDSEVFAQIEPASPATILYDSVDYPSAVTLVTVEPAPVAAPTP